MSELEKEKGTALFLLQKVPHIIPFSEVKTDPVVWMNDKQSFVASKYC